MRALNCGVSQKKNRGNDACNQQQLDAQLYPRAGADEIDKPSAGSNKHDNHLPRLPFVEMAGFGEEGVKVQQGNGCHQQHEDDFEHICFS